MEIPRVIEERLIMSGNIWEYYIYEKPYLKDYELGEKNSSGLKKEELTEEEKKENRLGNMQKSKLNVRRMINANADELTKFITLTYADNVTDIAWSNKEFNKFIKRLKYYMYSRGDPELKYIVVLEFQKRGAIHYHLLSNIEYIPNKELNKLWKHGFVKINSINQVDNLGAYVTKYMTKDINDKRLWREKAYFTSRNIRKSIETEDKHLIRELLTASGVQEKMVYTTKFNNDHLGEVQYTQYNFNQIVIQSKKNVNTIVHTDVNTLRSIGNNNV